MYDPTSKVSLPGYLRDLERRIADRERANPIARASFHDGTRTRGGLGKFAHPGGGEQTGAVFYDAAGDVLLLADDTALTLSKTAITGSAAVAAAASDYVLISDTSDSGELKKALVSSIGGGGGGGDMLAATYDPQTIADDAFDRANHTGTQTSATISDFDAEVSNNASVTANTAKVSYTDAAQVATNTGDISTIQGEQTTQDSAIALNTAKVSYNVDGAGTGSVLIKGTAAAGGQAVAVGANSSAAGTQSVAIGYLSSAAGYISVALGRNTSSTGNYDVSIGYLSSSTGGQGIAIGRDASATAANATAVGYLSEATASGAVAIGTGVVAATANTTSVNNLEVQGGMSVAAGSAAAPAYSFVGDTNTGIYRKANDTIGFSTAGADLFRMETSYLRGNVNYTPAMPGKAAGSAAAPAYSFVNDSNTGMYRKFADTLGFSTAGAGRMWVSASTFNVPSVYSSTTAASVNMYVNGNGKMFRSTSSIKYKKNVEPLEDKWADLVYEFDPVHYNSMCETDHKTYGHYGLIAEDVAKLDPRLVQFGNQADCNCPCMDGIDINRIPEEGEEPQVIPEAWEHESDCYVPEGVAYDRLVPHLIVLAKRYRDQIADLEARLQPLEKKV